MRHKTKLILSCLVFLLVVQMGFSVYATPTEDFQLTESEKSYLKQFENRSLLLGLDPFAGIEFFYDGDAVKGYILPLVALIEQRLNVTIEIVDQKSWAEVYQGLHDGNIDLLFGANPTPERLKTMVFTDSIYSVPYTVLTRSVSEIKTVGDLHQKRVGFIAEDVGKAIFEQQYSRIAYDTYIYPDQYAALEALVSEEIDGFITSGGDVVYDYMYQYPDLKEIARIDSIRSELTLSALNDQALFIKILERLFDSEKVAIDEMIIRARQDYIRKIIQLTPEERAFLAENPTIRVGVATDYLPIDYYNNDEYQGIAGHYFMEFANLIGLEIQPIAEPFDVAFNRALKGEIDVLNMAKTDEREANFIFTEPFSDERDVIYGLRSEPYVYDTYGLEGKRVAVIAGFWHEKYLERNLRSVEIVVVKDIQEALSALVTNKADYFIETPAVAEYYIVGLGYTTIIKKGETSAESFLYFGVQKNLEPLVTLFNKVQPLLNYEASKYIGAQGVPPLTNVVNRRLIILLVATLLTIILLITVVTMGVKKISRQSAEMLLLKERERLIYIDPLTELYNRNYFNKIEPSLDLEAFPQYIVMVDLNDLKLVNDRDGHLAGDAYIKRFATLLKSLDPNAVPIRMGGDEFLLILTNLLEADVQSLIQRLRVRGHQESVVAAIGYSKRESLAKTVESCLKEADAAMYQDKTHLKAVKS